MSGVSDFRSRIDVSRETLEMLKAYEKRLKEWNKRINLVSKTTMSEVWTRHFLDSAQLSDLISPDSDLLDLGSGAGFPGLILGILRPDLKSLTLLESDTRKCAFLRTIIRELGLKGTVINKRIEDTPVQNASVITARAVADLDKLLLWSSTHLNKSGKCVFLKGKTWQEELTRAQEHWHMDVSTTPSQTDPDSAILTIGALQRAGTG